MSESTDSDQPESRISLQEVPEQISRIFFGHPGGGRPSYLDDSYGAPSYQDSGTSLYNSVYYKGYEDDIFLLVKLGQAALIVFIIFAIISIIFMMISCCSSFVKRNNGDDPVRPAPFTMRMQESKPGSGSGIFARIGAGSGSGLSRSQGVTNLSLETEESSEDSDEIEVSQGRTQATGVKDDGRIPVTGVKDDGWASQRRTPSTATGVREDRRSGDSLDHGRRLSSSLSSSSSLSHNRSLPYYEVPTPRRVLPQHTTQFGSFSPPPTVPVVRTSPAPNHSGTQGRIV